MSAAPSDRWWLFVYCTGAELVLFLLTFPLLGSATARNSATSTKSAKYARVAAEKEKVYTKEMTDWQRGQAYWIYVKSPILYVGSMAQIHT
jgi:hypothetical protein